MGRSRHVLRVLVHTDHTEPTWTAVMRIWRHLEISWCQASSARAVAKAGFGCWTWIFAADIAAITKQYMAEQGNMCAIATFMTWDLYRELETIETNNDDLPSQYDSATVPVRCGWPMAHSPLLQTHLRRRNLPRRNGVEEVEPTEPTEPAVPSQRSALRKAFMNSQVAQVAKAGQRNIFELTTKSN